MEPSGGPGSEGLKTARLPGGIALIYLIVVGVLAHYLMPRDLSRLTPRRGWNRKRPGTWNWPGLILVSAGVSGMVWSTWLHFTESPSSFEFAKTPGYLLARGPYRYSRNPVYLSVLAVWAGWSLYYGSVAVLAGLLAWATGYHFVVIPWEERQLERRFGQTYLDYRRRVPRWLGRVKR